MTNIKHLQDDVAYVRTHVENLERMIAHQIRNDPAAQEAARTLFTNKPDLARIYLALEEPANQQSVCKTLTLDKSKVSTHVKTLVRRDFLRKLGDGSYAWTEFENLLNLSRIAEQVVKGALVKQKPTAQPGGGTEETELDASLDDADG